MSEEINQAVESEAERSSEKNGNGASVVRLDTLEVKQAPPKSSQKVAKNRVDLLSGNESIALAALHSGVGMAVGYPGTPSTETLEYLAKISSDAEVYVDWSTNEKVALDVAVGGSLAGDRILVTTKHVGLNVAMDSLMTSPLEPICKSARLDAQTSRNTFPAVCAIAFVLCR